MNKTSITTGDDAPIIHKLKKTNISGTVEPFLIPNTATVVCRLITLEHKILSEQVEQSSDAAGADWTNSAVAAVFPSNITSPIGQRTDLPWKDGKILAKIETQVDDSGKLTWYGNVEIIKGTIS